MVCVRVQIHFSMMCHECWYDAFLYITVYKQTKMLRPKLEFLAGLAGHFLCILSLLYLCAWERDSFVCFLCNDLLQLLLGKKMNSYYRFLANKRIILIKLCKTFCGGFRWKNHGVCFLQRAQRCTINPNLCFDRNQESVWKRKNEITKYCKTHEILIHHRVYAVYKHFWCAMFYTNKVHGTGIHTMWYTLVKTPVKTCASHC